VVPAAHTDGSVTLLHVPCVHESFVHSCLSSQSAAAQHETAHVAEVRSELAQQVALVPSHSFGCAHCPDTHWSFVHGSLSSHCESWQHAAQPTPGQHKEPAAQVVAVC
jgi:hypothetical protein